MQNDSLSVMLLTEDVKRKLLEALCQIKVDKPLGEIDTITIKDSDSNIVMLQIEGNFNRPTSISVNSFIGETCQLSFASSFSYVVTHEPQSRVGERCGITEFKDGKPSTFYLLWGKSSVS